MYTYEIYTSRVISAGESRDRTAVDAMEAFASVIDKEIISCERDRQDYGVFTYDISTPTGDYSITFKKSE